MAPPPAPPALPSRVKAAVAAVETHYRGAEEDEIPLDRVDIHHTQSSNTDADVIKQTNADTDAIPPAVLFSSGSGSESEHEPEVDEDHHDGEVSAVAGMAL